ncbi:MAG: redoxin domain-containing protein [Planctomycetales bacterium]|nr:redoxin domain-containing protein [Planctomycetales bacterium]
MRFQRFVNVRARISAVGWFAVIGGFCASQLLSAEPSPKLVQALSYTPRQSAVNYEKVADAELEKCSIEKLTRDDGTGFWITGPAGQPLRWFVDTDGDSKLDRWSYYNAGVEVYRESDTNLNQKADQYRWLSTEGMRWGIDEDEDGTIDSWKMISAEEVTAEVVAAAASRDEQQFQRLLISESEIASLGLGSLKGDTLRDRASMARKQFSDWAAGQSVVTRQSRWTNFGADKPGIVPAGTDGSDKDLVVYENVVALLEDEGNARQLLVGTMIQVGNTWRLVDLPKAVTDGGRVSDTNLFMPATFSTRGPETAASNNGGLSKTMERLIGELQEIDAKLISGGASDLAVLHSERADVLEQLVAESTTGEDRTTWIRQFADTVGAAAQTQEFPGGVKRLQSFRAKIAQIDASEDDLAYVEYRTIEADYREKMANAKESEFETLQKEYLEGLDAFVSRYPDSADAADALIQIALSAEFSGDTKAASEAYNRASERFPESPAGQKASGALRRLNLVGTRFGIGGVTLDRREFTSASYLGSPVIYHCWASWCDGCKAEMKALKQLRAKYAKTNLQIVGINFDNNPDDEGRRDAFLKTDNYSWVHLGEKKGLDGDLAVGYGILTLPLNIIVDKTGKVVKTGVHWTELDAVIEELVK